jgi:nitrogen regulatory protein PII
MKMLTAIIRPERLDDVVEALEAIGIDKLTVTEVAGVGQTPPAKHAFPQEPGLPQLHPRREIEIAVASERVPKAIAAIRAAAATDKPGDGNIVVAELEGAVRIRNRESGVKAL